MDRRVVGGALVVARRGWWLVATSHERPRRRAVVARGRWSVSTPWPGITMVSAGSVNNDVSIEWMIVLKSPPSSLVLPGPPGKSVSPLNSSGALDA